MIIHSVFRHLNYSTNLNQIDDNDSFKIQMTNGYLADGDFAHGYRIQLTPDQIDDSVKIKMTDGYLVDGDLSYGYDIELTNNQNMDVLRLRLTQTSSPTIFEKEYDSFSDLLSAMRLNGLLELPFEITATAPIGRDIQSCERVTPSATQGNDVMIAGTNTPLSCHKISSVSTIIPITVIDLSVNHIEVTQAIQDMDNSVPLIAEKDTWVRVYVGALVNPTFCDNCRLEISHVDAELTIKNLRTDESITIQSTGEITLKNNENSDYQRRFIDKTINFKIPNSWTELGSRTYFDTTLDREGKYEYTVEVNPGKVLHETNYNNNFLTEEFEFNGVKSLNINFHSTTISDFTRPSQVDFENDLNDFTMKAFPVSEYNITTGDDIDFSFIDDPESITGEFFGILIFAELKAYQCAIFDSPIPLIGVVIDPIGCTASFFGNHNESREIEYAYMGTEGRVLGDSAARGFTELAWSFSNSEYMAHEIGHAKHIDHVPIDWDSWDIYNSKMGQERVTVDGERYLVSCSDSKPASGGNIIGAVWEDGTYPQYTNPDGTELHRPSIGEVGFDGENVYLPELYSDFMAYCATWIEEDGEYVDRMEPHGGKWVSPHNYKKIFEILKTPLEPIPRCYTEDDQTLDDDDDYPSGSDYYNGNSGVLEAPYCSFYFEICDTKMKQIQDGETYYSESGEYPVLISDTIPNYCYYDYSLCGNEYGDYNYDGEFIGEIPPISYPGDTCYKASAAQEKLGYYCEENPYGPMCDMSP